MNTSATSNNDPSKEKIKQRFARIFKILTEGCGREYCFCKLCRNNPASSPTDRNTAAGIALKYVNTNTFICEDRIVPKSLQAPEVNAFVQEYSNSETYASTLYKRVAEVFGSYESLNLSFLNEQNFTNEFTSTSPKLDFDLMGRFFNVLQKVDQNQTSENSVKNVLNKSLCNAMNSFKDELKENRIVEVGQIRFLLVIFEVPQIFDFEFHTALKDLLSICLHLTPAMKQGLISWFSKHTKSSFSRLIENFQNIISIQIVTDTEEMPDLKSLVQFTKFLFEANKLGRITSVEDFYIETISQEEDPHNEYITWLRNRANGQDVFTYVDYPWVLECEFKSRILEEESKYEMQKEMKNDLNNALAGQNASGLFGQINTMLALQNLNLYYKLQVRRDNILEDTLKQLSKSTGNYKKPMKVKFFGEQGVDEGGVKKEFFQLITRQLLTPDYGMFVPKENDRYLWFNMNSIDVPLNFELSGMLLGLSIYNSVNLDIRFPIVVYKKLLDEPLTLRDLEELEPDLYRSLKHILEFEGDLENSLFMQFQVTYDYYGEQKVAELKPGGSEINVTQANKEEYVKLYLDWYLNKSIEPQFRPFYKGFTKVVTGDAIRLFTAEELQILICGSPHLDFYELEKATTYENGFSKDTPIIKSFWETVHSLSEQEKKQFLAFCTGSDRAPIKGLGSMPFIIARHGPDSEILPSAHTCFNHLLLPEYSSAEKLREKLVKAISNSEGFGLF